MRCFAIYACLVRRDKEPINKRTISAGVGIFLLFLFHANPSDLCPGLFLCHANIFLKDAKCRGLLDNFILFSLEFIIRYVLHRPNRKRREYGSKDQEPYNDNKQKDKDCLETEKFEHICYFPPPSFLNPVEITGFTSIVEVIEVFVVLLSRKTVVLRTPLLSERTPNPSGP